MELEITEIPRLTAGQLSLIENHSLLNVCNVLRGEFSLLGTVLGGDSRHLGGALERCDRIIQALGRKGGAIQEAARVSEHERFLFGEIDRHLPPVLSPEVEREVEESRANLRSVFAVLQVRARELLARAAAPEAWQPFNVNRLGAELRQVFSAIERNGRGRYQIVYNLAVQTPRDYYVDFRGEHPEEPALPLPPVFKDVIRDLLANSRKYTEPGGQIRAALFSDRRELRALVQDTGRGIPPQELREVVHFGRRASNALGVRTMGGGFGLTKAFLVTKQFGGRFWIDSELGRGTTVRIVLPKPSQIDWETAAATEPAGRASLN